MRSLTPVSHGVYCPISRVVGTGRCPRRTSIALGRAGLNRISRMATPMLLVSGLAADVDWATRLAGPRAFVHGHRTATHSLVGTVFVIAAVASGFWIAGRKFPKFAVNIFPALLICTSGAGIHLLLDLLNGYG